jgi:hypothetical protein
MWDNLTMQEIASYIVHKPILLIWSKPSGEDKIYAEYSVRQQTTGRRLQGSDGKAFIAPNLIIRSQPVLHFDNDFFSVIFVIA